MRLEKRKRALAALNKQVQLKKVAQEVAQEITSTDPDSYAEEYVRKLFMKLWDQTEVRLIEDD